MESLPGYELRLGTLSGVFKAILPVAAIERSDVYKKTKSR